MVLPRLRTVTVHLPPGLGAVDRSEFILDLLNVVERDNVKCVQAMRGYFRVTFESEMAKDDFACTGMSVRGISIPVMEADESRLVKLFNIPFEVPEGNVKAVLSKYGTVLSHNFEMDRESGILTGTRNVRMRINSAIPDRLVVLDYPFNAWYPGQPKVCRVCQATGHIASSCPNKGLCRICRLPGHMARSCPEKDKSEHSANPWHNRRPSSPNASGRSRNSSDEKPINASEPVAAASLPNTAASAASAAADTPVVVIPHVIDEVLANLYSDEEDEESQYESSEEGATSSGTGALVIDTGDESQPVEKTEQSAPEVNATPTLFSGTSVEDERTVLEDEVANVGEEFLPPQVVADLPQVEEVMEFCEEVLSSGFAPEPPASVIAEEMETESDESGGEAPHGPAKIARLN